MTDFPDAVAAKAKSGHSLESDPPWGMTAAERWTCTECGDAIIRYDSNIYGGVTERTCAESVEFWASL